MTDAATPRNHRRRGRPLDVAIVGMACRFPGARDVASFWENVLLGRSAVGDVPADRWDPAVFFDPDSKANDRVYCRRGGYLDGPVTFDPTRYGIMPIAVDGGEPEQFLVLDAARAALEDAGLPSGAPAGARVEVVIGRGNYFNRGNLTRLQHGRIVAQTLAVLEALHPEWTEAERAAVRDDLKASLPPFEAGTIPGQLTNATAGRVAERLNLSGASYVVDAASASSLVALDLGARALVDRRADLSVVGGVYLQPDVDFPMVFSRLGALSRRGEARPFTRSADGTLPGEGVGVVVLKRLADAERDGDRVYAVVKAVGLASDGRGAGLAAPSARGHARSIRRAYRMAGVDPATVDLVEGHGLGVPASDRAELRALHATFPRPAHGRRALGSLTALIGHAMPAAGIAGVIKTALALHHRVIPPSPDSGEPHDLLAAGGGKFELNPTARPWVHGDEQNPRRAGVNAFGFAGVNAHAVLEEHAPSADGATPGCMPRWDSEAVLLGAEDRAGWVALAGALLDWLDAGVNATVDLKDLAYTLNTGQGRFPFRVGLVATSAADLREKLRAAVARISDPGCKSVRDAKGTYFWAEPLGGPGRLAFLYPGEGSQYPGMLADLCPHFPEVRRQLDTVDRVARERGLERLPSEQLFATAPGGESQLWALGTAVSVVLSTQWALHQLLARLGLRPDAVVGHSSGEFIALAAAGIVRADRSFEDGLGDLGTVFEGFEKLGTVPAASLVAVAAAKERVEAALAGFGDSIRVAIDNCPHQVVIAGSPDAAAAAVALLRSQGMICEELPFQRAYHTPDFERALGPVRDFFHNLPMRPSATRLYSCAVAAPAGPDVESVRRLAVEQWVSPVAFRPTVEAMYADGVRLFVEVGARGSLTGYVEDTLRGRPHFAVAANLPRRSGLTQLNHLVAALYAHGVDLKPDDLYARRRPRRIDLSTDLPQPAPGRPLAVGFPEMRLSPELAERLRSRNGHADAPRPENTLILDENDDPYGPTNGDAPHAAFASRAVNGRHSGNGHASNGTGVAEFVRTTPATTNGHAATKPQARPQQVSPAAPAAQSDAAMLAFFETMDDFLETQRSVMQAYLGAGGRLEDVAYEPHAQTNGAAPTPAVAPPADIPSAPLPAEVAVPAVEPRPELGVADLLLEQVSQRTGYPREMLALELDMEGDLGIDSIKRVEILGELQERGRVPAGVDMERLSRCRTLGQVVEILERARAVETPVVAAAEPARWAGEVESFVPGREIVALKRLDAATDPVATNHTLGGRRLSAVEPSRLGLPVIPFTVMAELLAQAAAALVPDRVVVGFRDLQANRWIRYEDGPFDLEVRASRDESRPDEVRASIRTRGADRGPKKGGVEAPAVEGVVVFGASRDPGPVAPEFHLPEAGRCRFTAEELYRDQWLFHGPALQAVQRVGASSRHGIEGTLRVLPRRDLLPESLYPSLHTDPIVLDAFTHLLGCWGLDKKAGEEGDVMFPLRLVSLTVHGDDPPEGALVECRIRVLAVTRYRVKVDADLVAPDGRIWVAIRGWEDWRFYWPGCYRDVFRQPDSVFLGEPLSIEGAGLAGRKAVAVWLDPPADMGKPVWRDVLEWVQLSPDERRANHAPGEAEPAFSRRIWERVAAKEAARRLCLDRGEAPVYPADLVIEPKADGRLALRSLTEPGHDDLPSVAFASADGVALAVAADGPGLGLGVAVERVDSDEGERAVGAAREWLERRTEPGPDREEWDRRLGCAAVAARRALGLGPRGGGAGVEPFEVDVRTGAVVFHADAPGGPVRCTTARRGEYVWAWACVERVER